MPQKLIRREVLEIQAERWLGSVRIASPISFRVWAITSILCVGVLVIWIFTGYYTQRKHVTGVLLPEQGLLSITARTAGVITALPVREGMFVRAGETVAAVSDERDSATLGNSATNISEQIREQKNLIEADLVNTRNLAKQESSDLGMQKNMLREEIQQLDSQISIQGREIKTQSDFLEKISFVANQGFVSVLTVNQLKASEDEAELQLKSLRRDRLELQQKENDAQNTLSQLPLKTEYKISELKKQLSQAEEALQSNEADRAPTLLAPKDGIVTSVLVRRDQEVASAQPLLSIVPAGSPLQAVLLVPTSAVGFLRIGTKVALHYEAFPYQKFGVHYGFITGISRSALSPAEATEILVKKIPDEPVYRVEVALEAQGIEVYGKVESLMPGMTVDASLMLDKRRIVEWIFEPIYGIKGKY